METYNDHKGMASEPYRFISSPDNDKIRFIKRLGHKKYRDQQGKFLIEGINLVRAALSKALTMEMVLIADDFDYSEIAETLSGNVDYHRIYLVPRYLYEKISDAENGSGIIAVVNKSSYSLDTLESMLRSHHGCVGNILVLDRLQDPGNIGTMIRTAVAAGYSIVATIKGTTDIYSPKVLRASAGMIFDIAVVELVDANDLKKMVSRLDKKIVVTDPRKGVPYYKCSLARDVALVIGNEGNGISEEILESSDIRVNIPMQGEVESLNAAVCASLLMYEAMRIDE